MRMIFALPLLLVAACGVNNDPQNDTVTLEYDQNQVEETAQDLGNAADDAATEIGEAARGAGRAIENEVGDIDVDVDVRRNQAENSQ
ncbi:hypothetical protein [Sphingosinicella terrae]|jgi:hypothetical protein|uniref:hypothetical protein n=1 Tax=Sphingosinicella terrae TaxID=2172047 RepID=UPI000E0D1A85|nr:hypothetical protein [Sphingosinicella terrae]